MKLKHPTKQVIRDWIIKTMVDDPELHVFVDLARSPNRRRAWGDSFDSPEAREPIGTPWGTMCRWFAASVIVKDWDKIWPRQK